jgi:type IV secretory pathway TraG/TraD family ATPase VirD4
VSAAVRTNAHASEFHWYWASGLAVSAVIFVLPKQPADLMVRMMMTVGFFTGLILFLWSFLQPYRAYLAAQAEFRYAEGGAAILHAAKLAAEAGASAVATVIAPLLALVSVTALRVLALWPTFAVLAPMAPVLELAWWGTLIGTFGWIFARFGTLQDAVQKRALLREQIAVSGFRPLTEDDVRARDETLREAPVTIVDESQFRAGGFDWTPSDFQKNCIVFGQSGSGKTVCVLNALIDGILGSGSAAAERCSGLILDPKGDYRRKVETLCQRHGRGADLLILDPGNVKSSIRWNPFDSDDDELELAGRFAAVLQTLGMKSEEDTYWIDSARTFVRHAIGLLRTTSTDGAPPSFPEIARLASGSVSDGRIVKGSLAEERILRVADDNDSGRLAVDYFIDTWCTLAQETRSVVQSQLVNMIDPFMLQPYRGLFSGRSSVRMADVVDSGKILYVYMPIADKEAMSKIVCTFMKLEFFREVLKRPDKSRPSFFLCDEFQSFFTTGAGKGDADFFERSRQSRHMNVIATQNLPALLKQAKGTEIAVDNLLGHCAVKIFLRNTDPKTNELASKLFGQRIDALVNTSRSQSSTSTAGQPSASASTSAQYAAAVREEDFTKLAQPSAVDGIHHAESIIHLASRAAVSCERLRWRVHPI